MTRKSAKNTVFKIWKAQLNAGFLMWHLGITFFTLNTCNRKCWIIYSHTWEQRRIRFSQISGFRDLKLKPPKPPSGYWLRTFGTQILVNVPVSTSPEATQPLSDYFISPTLLTIPANKVVIERNKSSKQFGSNVLLMFSIFVFFTVKIKNSNKALQRIPNIEDVKSL